MGIKRYFATKDNTITNAFKSNLSTRATGSNMGESDILEVFSIYGQSIFSSSYSANASTTELSRILIQFPVSGSSAGEIKADRNAKIIPASGSVKFFLRLFNASHAQTTPNTMTLNVFAVSSSWDEGLGLDMDEYQDLDSSNWMKRNSNQFWGKKGGDYHSASYSPGLTMPMYSKTFSRASQDLEVDVTSTVEEWLANSKENYGFGVFLTSSQEGYFSSSSGLDSGSLLHNPGGATKSYYTKRFFGRGTEFFFKRPVLEARWNSSLGDDRGNTYFSSSLATSVDNLNTIYLYNTIRGRLQNIPDVNTGPIYVRLHSGSTGPAGTALTMVADGTHVVANNPTYITGGYVSTGIYTASFALTASSVPLQRIYDVWQSGSQQYFTGSIVPKQFGASEINDYAKCVTKITNLKPSYSTNEKAARFRLFIRQKNWQPNIYTVASSDPSNLTIEEGYYKLYRVFDNLEIIGYGTGSNEEYYTRMSHDISGNYFDLDISMLEADNMYAIKFLYKVNDTFKEQPEVFKFRVD